MQREIKFRAWDKNIKVIRNQDDLFYSGNWQNVFKRSDLILMQFTGLLDKNGKEIYEGDIVREKIILVLN